jgi:hypothetical protein
VFRLARMLVETARRQLQRNRRMLEDFGPEPDRAERSPPAPRPPRTRPEPRVAARSSRQVMPRCACATMRVVLWRARGLRLPAWLRGNRLEAARLDLLIRNLI